MPDLDWADVRTLFDPDVMGALPDGEVPRTTADDWQALLDLVVSRGWPHSYEEDLGPVPLPGAATMLGAGGVLHVWPEPGFQVNFWPLEPGSIDFDIDLCELRGQRVVDAVCRLFTTLGRHLRKQVLLCPEGEGLPVLAFDVGTGRVAVTAAGRGASPGAV
ncbi:hypothetical protein [Amycolatopsis thermoflava]|uniref:Uncharacterized protein n=1 Tax=Amycolatopsis thermoflava TaxID=84480 RepID=A0A3N2GN60_9PSEU|nr:hypothetical protein [Amycolatopsis thermoflava]ROS38076.1 hypothetical protein EDD35_0340 [Amycolatopsis thermoflava]